MFWIRHYIQIKNYHVPFDKWIQNKPELRRFCTEILSKTKQFNELNHIRIEELRKNLANNELIKGEKIYFVKSNNEKKLIPNFLIDINDHVYDDKTLLKGLKLVGDYIDKSILKPNNIAYPSSRLEFVNLIKL